MRSLKLLVIDSNNTVREKIAGIMSRHENMRAVCQMAAFDDAPGMVADFQPHAVLVDMDEAVRNAHVLGALQRTRPGIEIIVMCESHKDLYAKSEAAEQIRAHLIIDKHRVTSELEPVIERIAATVSQGPGYGPHS